MTTIFNSKNTKKYQDKNKDKYREPTARKSKVFRRQLDSKRKLINIKKSEYFKKRMAQKPLTSMKVSNY